MPPPLPPNVQTMAAQNPKPIKLYSHPGGPNPWKVAIICTELHLPYENILLDFSQLKNTPFDSMFPNGRVPAIEDPNTGMRLWESGAIIEYLLETYDGAGALAPAAPLRFEAKCWLHFQMSGQGPYFGQRAWFLLYHPEKELRSCLERYGNEIRRVLGVLEAHLRKRKTRFLVGERCTYADLAFVPWHWLLMYEPFIMGDGFAQEWESDFPECWAWNQRLQEREAVVKCREERIKAIEASRPS